MMNLVKKTMRLMGVGVAALVLPGAGAGDAAPLEMELGVDVVSKYVWRGMLLTDDPVIQPGVTASAYGFSANVWSSIDVSDINEMDGDDDYKIQEVDYTLSYALSPVEGLDLEAGYVYYSFPGTPFSSTAEVFGSLCASAIPLSPALTIYYDVDEIDGFYGSFSLGHAFEISESLSVGLGAAVGYGESDYNNGYFGVDDDALNDLALSVSLDYAVNEMCSVSGYVGFSTLLDSEIDEAVAESDIVTVGANLTFSF
jgi:uncharacterized protein (TIGR02001 family)